VLAVMTKNQDMTTIEQKIAHVKRNTEEFISQIDKIEYNKGLGLCKFILVSCLVDAVATYAYQKKYNNKQYKDFIKTYLGQINIMYKNDSISNDLYHGIRSSLIHSFTISDSILLTEADDPSIHLLTNKNGHLIVDLVTLFEDLKKAIKLFFKDLNSGKGNIQKNFRKGFAKNPPFEIFKNVDLLNPNQPASGTTKFTTTSYQRVNFKRITKS
jgi:hypothetical protein